MMKPNNPADAYRRVDFDARVAGSTPRDLTLLCYERLDLALARAVLGEERGDAALRSQALTEALAALTALQLGLDQSQALSAAFNQLFAGARQQLLKSVPSIDIAAVNTIRTDFSEIAKAL